MAVPFGPWARSAFVVPLPLPAIFYIQVHLHSQSPTRQGAHRSQKRGHCNQVGNTTTKQGVQPTLCTLFGPHADRRSPTDTVQPAQYSTNAVLKLHNIMHCPAAGLFSCYPNFLVASHVKAADANAPTLQWNKEHHRASTLSSLFYTAAGTQTLPLL